MSGDEAWILTKDFSFPGVFQRRAAYSAPDVARGRAETGAELCRGEEEDDSARDGVTSKNSTPDQRTAFPYCPKGQIHLRKIVASALSRTSPWTRH